MCRQVPGFNIQHLKTKTMKTFCKPEIISDQVFCNQNNTQMLSYEAWPLLYILRNLDNLFIFTKSQKFFFYYVGKAGTTNLTQEVNPNYKNKPSWALVAHPCNPSYWRWSWGSKPALANSSRDPISKNPITIKGWWSGSKCRLQYCKKKKKKKKPTTTKQNKKPKTVAAGAFCSSTIKTNI
jgi:hypothetical protein